MKIDKSSHAVLRIVSAITCVLAATACANTTQKQVRASAADHSTNLDESARANHNSLLPSASYESNHSTDG